MNTLKVNCIYPAFMGECNKHGIGVPCTFVRLSGCNLRCYKKTLGTLCDTPEALQMNSGLDMTVEEILHSVTKLSNRVVCLTGGEPLLQDVHSLMNALLEHHFKIVVETNGSQSIEPYVDLREVGDISFVVDVKPLSSGESFRMREENYGLMEANDYVKFVLYDFDDYGEMIRWIDNHRVFQGQIGVGLFWGSKLSYQTLIDYLIKNNVPAYLNMQTHKMACLYDAHKNNLDSIYIPKRL